MQSFGKRNLLGGVPEGGRWERIIRMGSKNARVRKAFGLVLYVGNSRHHFLT